MGPENRPIHATHFAAKNAAFDGTLNGKSHLENGAFSKLVSYLFRIVSRTYFVIHASRKKSKKELENIKVFAK
jgi:hypothetical protein